MSTSAAQPSAGDMPRTRSGRPVPQYKVDQVTRLSSLLEEYDYICLVRTEQIGSKQLQEIKRALRGKAIIRMAKNTLMLRALELAEKNRKGISKLAPYVQGSCAFIFTKLTPFALNELLRQNKAKAPAKAGTVSPNDIIIPAGNTGFPPGPLISEFNQVGLKTRIQGGSIWITEDHVLVKAGETVTKQQALVLSRLGILPYESWLKIQAAYDNGTILSGEVFEITQSEILSQLQEAAQESLALALAVDILAPETLPHLIQRAHLEAQSLAVAAAIPLPGLIPSLLARAEQQAAALAQAVTAKNPDALPS